MDAAAYMDFIKNIGRLKVRTRHCWFGDRQESVADHSWRLAVMALLLGDKAGDVDLNRVVAMCLVHDWGEAVTGDIPTFFKTAEDERTEEEAVAGLCAQVGEYYVNLFAEMKAQKTPEARLWKALDKLEAVIAHNEAELSSWLPMEHEFNCVYGTQECAEFPFLKQLRELARVESVEKTARARQAT